MEEHRLLNFERGRPPLRLDLFLAEELGDLTRSQLKRLIDEERVLLWGKPAKAGLRLKGGETVAVTIPAARPAEALPQDIPLQVLYEDAHLIVLDKPAGLVVHPAPGHPEGTLVNALLHHCQDLAGIGGTMRPGIVHRLDKDTSGVMVATKDDTTHLALARQFRVHSITRRYVALVHGLPEGNSGTIDRAIGRHPVDRKKMSGQTRSGRHAVTHWRVLRTFPQARLSLLELTLETGRTHQIRVHLSEVMHLPLVGDPVYGNRGRLQAIRDTALRSRMQQLGRQALHARLLGFIHPASGCYMEFESPLPPDLTTLLEFLECQHHTATATATAGDPPA